MTTVTGREGKERFPVSPWLVIGSAAILLVVVIVFGVRNYNREKAIMSRVLSEKGAALIKSVEAGARTGMMGMRWGDRQVQTLVEETALLPEVLYITIADADGRIEVASDTGSIGGLLEEMPDPGGLEAPGTVRWRLIDTVSEGRAFEVFAWFRPLVRPPGWMRGHMGHGPGRHGMMMELKPDGMADKGDKKQIILVGLDPQPFEAARMEDLRNTGILSAVLLLLGLGGFVSMFWMVSYRAARRSLRDTSAVADEIVACLPVGLVATGRDGHIAFSNEAIETITGVDLSTAAETDPETLLPGLFSRIQAILNQGHPIHEIEMECEFVKGRPVPVSVSASRIVNAEGEFLGNVVVLRDLGEVRRLEAEVRRREKLAAIGGLAAGVAHEIRNPLSSIKGIATYFKGRFKDDRTDAEMADVMILEVDRLNRAVTELLEFARPTDLKIEESTLGPLIEHSLQLVEKEASARGVTIDTGLFDSLPRVGIDPDRFTQVLLNLYLNAIQAMEQGGVLSVRTDQPEDGRIRIEVRDTGPGIRAEHLDKIFDPYFTTKAKGTGLGLAIVHKIVEALGGTVRVRSSAGKGTAFLIDLPEKQEF